MALYADGYLNKFQAIGIFINPNLIRRSKYDY
jgi:hypothetical protein